MDSDNNIAVDKKYQNSKNIELNKTNVMFSDKIVKENHETLEKNNNNEVLNDHKNIELNNVVKKMAKKTPSTPAKNHQIGYTILSDNDNNSYSVIETKNNIKKWKKLN